LVGQDRHGCSHLGRPDTQVNVAVGSKAGFWIQPGRAPAFADQGVQASVAEQAEQAQEMLFVVGSLTGM
jgi:hypothetical protein